MLIDERMQNMAKLMDVAQLRAEVHAGNLANANTPGYRAREVRFEDAFREAQGLYGGAAARRLQAEVLQSEGGPVDNDGNNVSLDKEVQALAQNALLYDTYVSISRGKARLLDVAIRGGAV